MWVHAHTDMHTTNICKKKVSETHVVILLARSDPLWEDRRCFVTSRVLGRWLGGSFFSPEPGCLLILLVLMCPSDNHTDSWKTTLTRIPGPHSQAQHPEVNYWLGKAKFWEKKKLVLDFPTFLCGQNLPLEGKSCRYFSLLSGVL